MNIVVNLITVNFFCLKVTELQLNFEKFSTYLLFCLKTGKFFALYLEIKQKQV